MSLISGMPAGKVGLYLYLREKEKRVGFDAVEHKYYYNNRALLSSTRSYKKFFPKFMSAEISENLARKELGDGVGFDLILKKAKEIRADWYKRANFGTCFHSIAEYHLLSHSQEILDISYIYQTPDWKPEFKDLLPVYLEGLKKFLAANSEILDNLVITELVVWDSEFSIAGQIDFMTYNSDGSVDLWDWKTNKDITSEGVNFGKYGYGQLAHLPDTNFYHYALQLSIYRFILERWGLKVRNLNLVHANKSEFKIIPVPYLSDEVSYILNSIKE